MIDDNIDHSALREAVSGVLDSECTLSNVRKYVSGDRGLSEIIWQHAGTLGWLGIAAPEAFGGSALGFDSLATIYEQLGRHLAPISFLQTQLCIEALIRAGTDQQKEAWLEPVGSGSIRGTVSMLDGAAKLMLTRAGSCIRLDGATLIADDSSVQLIVAFARDSFGKLCAVAVDREQADVELAATAAYDGTRALVMAKFNGCEVPADSILAEDDAAIRLQDHLVDHAAIALACDSLGGACAIFDITVAYLKTRHQFGRPIGSFQALKHRCATLKVGLEASSAMLARALEERKAHSGQSSAYASLAKFHACDLYATVSAEAIQLHGGIGFTWECPCHLFLKRAKFNQALFGESAWHQDRAAWQLLIPCSMSILEQKHDMHAFRLALRAWFADTVPRDWQKRMTGASREEFSAFQYWWLKELNNVGLATPHWPAKWGGEDLSIPHQIVFFEEMARADAPDPVMFTISLYHLPATLAIWGTEAQIDRYLPGARRGDVWCQGFSEPGAGSDLAALRTSAIRQGDHFIVNGQKVWSSYAAYADYYLLLARSDPIAPKHSGISCLIVDLKSPGIDIRPIRQINGDNEFCEVFLDNVRVPSVNLVGPENKGWQVAQTTLSAERGLLVFSLAERMNRLFHKLFAEAAAHNAGWTKDDQMRREFVRAYADLQAVRRLIRTMLDAVQRSGSAGDLPATIKILYSEMLQRFCELWTRIEGLNAQVWNPSFISSGYAKGLWMTDYLNSWTWTIAGGSNEILRNVIAERQLGLPKEPRG